MSVNNSDNIFSKLSVWAKEVTAENKAGAVKPQENRSIFSMLKETLSDVKETVSQSLSDVQVSKQSASEMKRYSQELREGLKELQENIKNLKNEYWKNIKRDSQSSLWF